MTSTPFVLMYHPALGNAQASVSLSSVDDHALKGWLLVDPGVTPPAPSTPYITLAALLSQITAGAAPVGTALRAAFGSVVDERVTPAVTAAVAAAPTVTAAAATAATGAVQTALDNANVMQTQTVADVGGVGFVDSSNRAVFLFDDAGNLHPMFKAKTDALYAAEVLPDVALPTIAAIPATAVGTLSASVLNQANKYSLNTWIPATYPGSGDILSFGGIGEQQIRPPAAVALSLATALVTGAHDATVTGQTAAVARTTCHRLTGALLRLHRTNGGIWGGDSTPPPSASDFASTSWQSALWAMLAASAAWLTWADLTADEQKAAKRMVAWEADRMARWHLPYWKNLTGAQNYTGDSKSEEIAWDASILVLATAMMPTHPSADRWTAKLVEMGVAYAARPADLTATDLVNGFTPPDVLEGSNVQADGMVVNHGIIHPAYTISPAGTLWGALFAPAAVGRDVPRAISRGAPAMYGALSTNSYTTAGGYQAPGGTVYTPGSGAIYYPQANDYGTNQAPINMAAADVQAAKFGWDTGLPTTGTAWAQLHLQYVANMQARSTTGQAYTSAGEDDYLGREQWIGHHAAFTVLTLCTAAVRWSNAPTSVIATRNRGV